MGLLNNINTQPISLLNQYPNFYTPGLLNHNTPAQGGGNFGGGIPGFAPPAYGFPGDVSNDPFGGMDTSPNNTGHDESDIDSPGTPQTMADHFSDNFSMGVAALSPTMAGLMAIGKGLMDHANEPQGMGMFGPHGDGGAFSGPAMQAAGMQNDNQMAENEAQYSGDSSPSSDGQGFSGGQGGGDIGDQMGPNTDIDFGGYG